MSSRAPRFQVLSVLLVCWTGLAMLGYVLRFQEPASTNRLAEAQSNYLRLAMHQLVDWSEWGQEAFEKARKQKKLVFLDMGAFWCHECRQMDRENYDDSDIADILNRQYVPVRVDVDAHPELLRRFEIAAEIRARDYPAAQDYKGGLPLLAVLTPDGYMIYATSPLKKTRLKEVLSSIQDEWSKQPEQHASEAEEYYNKIALDPLMTPESGALSLSLINDMERQAAQVYDGDAGGFRSEDDSKSLRPCLLEFLLTRYLKQGDQQAKLMAEHTLDTLPLTAVYDQLWGGFFHGTFDAQWNSPHFAKLLSDNAQMLRVYALAYSIFKKPLYKQVAYETRDYLINTLWDKERGAFWASQSGEVSPDDDGGFYRWSAARLQRILSAQEFKAAALYYGLNTEPEVNGSEQMPLHVALRADMVAQRLGMNEQQATALLQSARLKMRADRVANMHSPEADNTIYAHLNGAAIQAFVAAYRVFQDESFADYAVQAMNCLRTQMAAPDGGLYHRIIKGEASLSGWLDDQVWAARGALDLYQVTGELGLLRYAQRLTERAITVYEQPGGGGFYDLPNSSSESGVPMSLHMPVKDDPLPAANVAAATVLEDLRGVTGDLKWSNLASQALASSAGSTSLFGLDIFAYANAVLNDLIPSLHVVIIGDPSSLETQALYQIALDQNPAKARVVFYQPRFAPKAYKALARPAAYLCRASQCLPPITDPAQLKNRLAHPQQLNENKKKTAAAAH